MTATTVAPRTSPTQPGGELLISSLRPEYGVNYNAGYIGFTYSNNNIISLGIAHFTRWTRLHQIKVSHALIVSGENECIEAHAEGGVRRSKLDHYFNDPHCQIFFRKPQNLSPELAGRLIGAAAEQLGCGYDFDLIAAQLEANSLMGALMRRVFGRSFEEKVCRIQDHPERWICSELVAHCLDAQPEYHDKGVLACSDATIDPQELFEDNTIFTAWHQ